MPTKDETAQRLADAHFRLDQGVSRIFRILEPNETDQSKPVKLLEVNPMTPQVGVMPIGLSADPGRGVFYSSVIVELTPEEFDELRQGGLRLPDGWQLGDELFPTEHPAEAGR